MPSLILSNPLDADDAQAIGLNIRSYAVGEIITVNDFAAVTLIRTGYAVAYGTGQDVLLTGGGPPTDATGTDGQWYLDTQAEVLWGPKTGGYWPSNPIRPDRGVAHFAIDSRGHLMMTYSTGTTVDLGTIVGPANVLTAGPVTTLAAGSPAAVTIKNTGTGQQELDLSIPQGAQGVQGIQGVQGATGPTGPGFTARGAWTTATAYAVNDIVTANSSTFRVKTAHTSSGSAPTAATPGANYEVWAAAGAMADATTTAKGAIKLAGALGGTADLPTIAVAGQANGVASLDGNGKVPAAQIPAGATGSDQGSVTVDTTTTPGSAIVNLTGNWGLTNALTNLAQDPRATGLAFGSAQAGWSTGRWFGTGGAGTHTWITGAVDGPAGLGIPTYLRKKWTTAPSSNGDTGFGNTVGADNGTETTGLPVTGGASYTISSYLRASSAKTSAGITVWWHDAAGVFISQTDGPTVALTAGVWTRISGTFTAPANAAYVQFVSDVDAGTLWAVNDTLDGTGLLVDASDSLHDYFDGSSNGGTWTGTANASTSTKPPQVYYDPAGAVASEAAMLVPDPDGGGFSLFRPGGPWVSEDARVAGFAQDTTSRLYAALSSMTATGQRVVAKDAGTNYTLTLADVGGLLWSNAAGGCTITVPPNASVPLPIGTVVEVLQASTGQVAVAAGAGVTIQSPSGSLAIRVMNGRARLIKTGTDYWSLAGDLTDILADQATRPMLKVHRATTFSLPTNAFTPIPWDTLDFDTAGGSYTSGATTVKIVRSGYYWIQGGIDLSPSVAGRRYVRFYVNRGGTDIALNIGRGGTPGTGTDTGVEASGLAQLQANDLLRMEAYQDTGSTQATGMPDFSPVELSLMWMRY